MATYDMGAVHTALELAKRHNNKEQLEIAMVLAENNQFFETAKWKSANRMLTDVITRQVSVPVAVTRAYNEGYVPTVMQTKQIVEPIANVIDRSEIDRDLVDDAPNPRQYRFEEDLGHMEGMAQKAVDLFLGGSVVSDEKGIDGLNTRFASLTTAGTYPHNVHGNGASTAATSVYLVQWGRNVYLTHPMGAPNLVKREDNGKIWLVTNTTTNAGMFVYQTEFKLKMGLSIRDDESVQRIANVGSAAADNLDLSLVITARNNMPQAGAGAVMYVNIATKTQLDILALTQNNIVYRQDDNFGRPVTMVQGIPVKMIEGIGNSQTVVA
jgi:hypothetical protein